MLTGSGGFGMELSEVPTEEISGAEAHIDSCMRCVTWRISFKASVTSVVRGRSVQITIINDQAFYWNIDRSVLTLVSHSVQMDETGMVVGVVYSHSASDRIRKSRR